MAAVMTMAAVSDEVVVAKVDKIVTRKGGFEL